MINSKLFENLQHQLSQGLSSLPLPHEEIQKVVRQALQSTFAKLDLVTRDEFDIQVEVLQRTRARLEALEVRLKALELGEQADTENDVAESAVKVNPQADDAE